MVLKRNIRNDILAASGAVAVFALLCAAFAVFFDQAVFIRRNTFYRAQVSEKVVALTFDDGPSPEWTPPILDELKRAGIPATFFMIGEHVREYPAIARRVAAEGHDIGNHTFTHPVLLFARHEDLMREIRAGEDSIREVTGKKTTLFRPPKAWLTQEEKRTIKDSGYTVVLWTLNSKDWVTFDGKYIIRYIMRNVQPGDIILFHDSGGIFGAEGGNRDETVKTIFRLVEKLKEKGYRCVTISELLAMEHTL